MRCRSPILTPEAEATMTRRATGLRRVGADLTETLRKLEIDGPAREALAVGLWAEVVGETIAAATRAVGIRGGVLEIRTRSDSWRQELSFQKATIIRRLNARLGAEVVTDFRCRVGAVPPPPRPAERAEISHNEIAAIPVPPDVDERLAGTARRAQRASDPDIAMLVRRALTHEWQLNEWRRGHGYEPC